MKIAYIVPSLRNQGPVIVVHRLVKVLVKLGCDIDVYYFDSVKCPLSFNCATKKITMSEKIKFDDYEIIHSHCLRPDIYVYKNRKFIHTAKIISTLHQDTYKSFNYQYCKLLSYIFTKFWCIIQSSFDGVITISNQLKELYENKIFTEITTIYNGCELNTSGIIDEHYKHKLTSMEKNYHILGTYAYITKGKGINQVLKILPNLPEYAFIIIGEGPELNNLKDLSHKLNIDHRVLFIPYQTNPYHYLQYFDVYVMPSYSEGFGLAMVEAALAIRSIVCSDIPSFRELFNELEVNFFQLDNLASLRHAIISAYENKRHYGLNAYMKANKQFTSEVMGKKHLEYYSKMCKI